MDDGIPLRFLQRVREGILHHVGAVLQFGSARVDAHGAIIHEAPEIDDALDDDVIIIDGLEDATEHLTEAVILKEAHEGWGAVLIDEGKAGINAAQGREQLCGGKRAIERLRLRKDAIERRLHGGANFGMKLVDALVELAALAFVGVGGGLLGEAEIRFGNDGLSKVRSRRRRGRLEEVERGCKDHNDDEDGGEHDPADRAAFAQGGILGLPAGGDAGDLSSQRGEFHG